MRIFESIRRIAWAFRHGYHAVDWERTCPGCKQTVDLSKTLDAEAFADEPMWKCGCGMRFVIGTPAP